MPTVLVLCMFVCLHAVPTVPFPATNIRAQRTADNALIVVQWDPFEPTEGPALPRAGYQVQVEYRLAGEGRSLSMLVNGTEEQLVVEGVTNAESYEVGVFVCGVCSMFVCLCVSMQCVWGEYVCVCVHAIVSMYFP